MQKCFPSTDKIKSQKEKNSSAEREEKALADYIYAYLELSHTVQFAFAFLWYNVKNGMHKLWDDESFWLVGYDWGGDAGGCRILSTVYTYTKRINIWNETLYVPETAF